MADDRTRGLGGSRLHTNIVAPVSRTTRSRLMWQCLGACSLAWLGPRLQLCAQCDRWWARSKRAERSWVCAPPLRFTKRHRCATRPLAGSFLKRL